MKTMIDGKKLQVSFFFILFGIVSALTFLVYRPFLQVIILSAIFAVLLFPFYESMCGIFHGRKNLSALFVVFSTVLFIAIPLYFLSTQIFNESQSLYVNLQESQTDFVGKLTRAIERPVREVYPNFSFDLGARLGDVATIISQNIGKVVSGTALAVFEVLIVLVTLFFFLRDGERFICAITKVSPLDDQYDKEILEKMQKTVNSVLRGTLCIALVQGFLAGAGFFIFGVPNAALWSAFAAITALVPGVGTALIIFPSVLYLLLVGNAISAFGLFLWGTLLVGLIDNVLAPMFYSKGIPIHPLFVFFSVLGGIAFFGPFGFLFGPVILSAFLALLHIYRIFILEEKEE